MNDTDNSHNARPDTLGSEGLIRQIYQITNAHDKGFEFQMRELLRMGLQRFNLDIGILSRIKGDAYTVQHCVVPEGLAIAPGDQFAFDETYCHITCGSGSVLALEEVGKHDEHASHPAYKSLGLESYIGVPIRQHGELYGTLNFSSAAPYPRKFDKTDLDAIALMASWIETELVRREQEAQLQQLNQKLEKDATVDGLTQVPNRRGMEAYLRREINRLIRSGGRATLALIDLDHFKQLNDKHGHQAGDHALVAAAKAIGGSIRDYDFLARFGGEEFLILLPDTSVKLSGIVCQRILDNIAAIELPHGGITASAGSCQIECSGLEPGNIDKIIEQAIAQADEALYAAKAAGRNRYMLFGQHSAAA